MLSYILRLLKIISYRVMVVIFHTWPISIIQSKSWENFHSCRIRKEVLQARVERKLFITLLVFSGVVCVLQVQKCRLQSCGLLGNSNIQSWLTNQAARENSNSLQAFQMSLKIYPNKPNNQKSYFIKHFLVLYISSIFNTQS